jgi:hypothetical protein
MVQIVVWLINAHTGASVYGQDRASANLPAVCVSNLFLPRTFLDFHCPIAEGMHDNSVFPIVESSEGNGTPPHTASPSTSSYTQQLFSPSPIDRPWSKIYEGEASGV